MLNNALRGIILYIQKYDPGMLPRKCLNDLLPNSRGAPANQHHSIAQARVGSESVIGFSRLHAVVAQTKFPAVNFNKPTS